MKINKDKHNYFRVDTNKVCEKFEGDLTYCNTFSMKGKYLPFAVFHNATPNREKKHKDYMLIQRNEGLFFVSGMDSYDIDKWRYQSGLYCPNCEEVIYSVYHHDYRRCSCYKCMVDGGAEYFRTNFGGTEIIIDLLSDEITIKI